jgi:hypothetical protein
MTTACGDELHVSVVQRGEEVVVLLTVIDVDGSKVPTVELSMLETRKLNQIILGGILNAVTGCDPFKDPGVGP